MRKFTCWLWLALVAVLGNLAGQSFTSGEEPAAVVKRVGEDIRYLASDALEGRGPGTAGLQKAADYMRGRFQELGVTGGGQEGGFYRPFQISIDTEVNASETQLVLRGPDSQEIVLELGKQFQPLAAGGQGKVKADLVFAGYGISAPKFEYDDYQDADVAGKVVIVIRREPQQGDEKSVFEGKKTTSHSFIRTKLQAAKKARAAAILMVNDPFTTKQQKQDVLSKPSGFGTSPAGIPFAHVSHDAIHQLLNRAPVKVGDASLMTVETIADKIDETLAPATQPLEGWSAEFRCRFKKVQAEVTNVIGVIEGAGPLANETVVVGAHYDHLGYGPFGSRKPNVREIHNGADDNATGTAAIMELARRFAGASEKPRRRLVFIGFTAEERGLVGSNRYLKDPVFPLEDTVAMLNFDMIGNLGDKGLQLGGVQTAKQFQALADQAIEEDDLKVQMTKMLGGSDHSGFYGKGIPVLFCFTGLTDLYHTPEDDFETINVEGVVETIDFAERLLRGVVEMPERPTFVKPAQRGPRRQAQAYLGIVPNYDAEDKGLRVTSVNEGSPAAKAGVKDDDLIIQIGDVEVLGIEELTAGLRNYRAGQKVKLIVRRGDGKETLEVVLGRPGK
ncbi:MAG TPA: aminopeptidase [Planctomycetaceae bacterium]|nr:aminopeptidase [Planctomycetaceae bacterium]